MVIVTLYFMQTLSRGIHGVKLAHPAGPYTDIFSK